jgi:N utilization substance protein A
VANSLAPAQVLDIEGNVDDRAAKIVVAEDQLSLAIGKEGQNARLAARLTGWKIDISGTDENPDLVVAEESDVAAPADDFVALNDLKGAIDKARSEGVSEPTE